MARKHGKRTKEFLDRIRSGSVAPEEIDRGKTELEETIDLVRKKPSSPAAKSAARAAVESAVLESGAFKPQAQEAGELVDRLAWAEE
jgi:hypothetical protein